MSVARPPSRDRATYWGTFGARRLDVESQGSARVGVCVSVMCRWCVGGVSVVCRWRVGEFDMTEVTGTVKKLTVP